MQQRSRRRARPKPTRLFRAPVLRTERVTPAMVRVTLCGGDLAEFEHAGTDSHVMLYFYPEGAQLPDPLTAATARGAFASLRPQMRSYTVRRFDPVSTELDIDFVLHGGAERGMSEPGVSECGAPEPGAPDRGGPGAAAEWARTARPGDELLFVGPSPAYEPDPQAGRYLLVGDESALPAIQVTLPELATGIPVTVIVEVADRCEQQPMPVPVTWVHRGSAPPAEPARLRAALEAIPLDPATDAWLAGERTVMHELRRYLLDAGLPRERVRPTTYWRSGT